jgi:hypothetical protein
MGFTKSKIGTWASASAGFMGFCITGVIVWDHEIARILSGVGFILGLAVYVNLKIEDHIITYHEHTRISQTGTIFHDKGRPF